MKRLLTVMLFLGLTLGITGCSSKDKKNPNLDLTKEVNLKFVGPWSDLQALEKVANKFCKKYDNCIITYEYLQNYYTSLNTRLKDNNDVINMFIIGNIQSDLSKTSAFKEYALDLNSDSRLDLSNTFYGLIDNFKYRNADEKNNIYSVPLGAEIRGMYVNKTLLASCGLDVPKNKTEFLNACAKLKEKGYTPLQGNPGSFAQHFLIPSVCNTIANIDGNYDIVAKREAGIANVFDTEMSFLYDIVKNDYYNYKKMENEGFFTDTRDEALARYFLNILEKEKEYEKKDDLGIVAFMPSTLSLNNTILKTKEDYQSKIEYEFILSPVSDNGGYAYMSPSTGLAINKNTTNLDWTIEFYNFLFQEENNKLFADNYGITPNTKDAFKIISKQFAVPNKNISHVGQVTFDFEFYTPMAASLLEACKANNPKYMNNGELFSFEYYMSRLEKRLLGEEV